MSARHPASSPEIGRAVEILRAGGLVGVPTETVYGLGADADNPLAVRRIFAAKGRPADHPLIVHVATSDEVEDWGTLTAAGIALAEAYWPGPLTLILRRKPRVADEVTGGRETVGVRVPRHPVATALLRAFGGGIAAPSANRFGRVSPTSSAHVRDELGDELFVLEGGSCAVGLESTIVDLSDEMPALLRPGGITREQVEAVVGKVRLGGTTAAPGTLAAHYAPRTSLHLAVDVEVAAAALRAEGRSVAVLNASAPETLAATLYAELRRLDALGVDVLVAPRCSDDGLGLAINDRLARAARGSGRQGGA